MSYIELMLLAAGLCFDTFAVSLTGGICTRGSLCVRQILRIIFCFAVFQAGLLRADSAQKELKKLEESTGMFGSLSDDEIEENTGKTYQDVTALRDPLMGLG